MAEVVDGLLGFLSSPLQEAFQLSMQNEEFKKKLSSCVTAEERVDFMQKYFKWTPLAPELLSSKFVHFRVSSFMRN